MRNIMKEKIMKIVHEGNMYVLIIKVHITFFTQFVYPKAPPGIVVVESSRIFQKYKIKS